VRIIAGQLKGRKVHIPKNNWPTRPTTDRSRETLFNIITHRYNVSGAKVLDLFAGTGMVSWEFLSRGAEHITMVERSKKICSFIRTVAKDLDCDDKVSIIPKDVYSFLNNQKEQFQFIFADPPYHDNSIDRIIHIIKERDLLDSEGLFILEHSSALQFDHGSFDKELRIIGDSSFSLFKRR